MASKLSSSSKYKVAKIPREKFPLFGIKFSAESNSFCSETKDSLISPRC